MANTFKNAALADVNNAAYDTLYTCPSATTAIVLGVAITNKTAQAVNITVQFADTSASTTHQLLNQVDIPGRTTLEVLAGHNSVFAPPDVLKCTTGTSTSIHVTLGLMEIHQ